jgi:hypothetical protein
MVLSNEEAKMKSKKYCRKHEQSDNTTLYYFGSTLFFPVEIVDRFLVERYRVRNRKA